MFLRLLLWFGGLGGAGFNFRFVEYPLFRSASWYEDAASLNVSSSEEIASRIFLIMLGGWFDLLSTLRGVVVGFEYGLWFSGV